MEKRLRDQVAATKQQSEQVAELSGQVESLRKQLTTAHRLAALENVEWEKKVHEQSAQVESLRVQLTTGARLAALENLKWEKRL